MMVVEDCGNVFFKVYNNWESCEILLCGVIYVKNPTKESVSNRIKELLKEYPTYIEFGDQIVGKTYWNTFKLIPRRLMETEE